jgi:hypothetical protein
VDEDEIDRLLRELGLELPEVEGNGPDDGEPPPLDDMEDWEWS